MILLITNEMSHQRGHNEKWGVTSSFSLDNLSLLYYAIFLGSFFRKKL